MQKKSFFQWHRFWLHIFCVDQQISNMCKEMWQKWMVGWKIPWFLCDIPNYKGSQSQFCHLSITPFCTDCSRIQIQNINFSIFNFRKILGNMYFQRKSIQEDIFTNANCVISQPTCWKNTKFICLIFIMNLRKKTTTCMFRLKFNKTLKIKEKKKLKNWIFSFENFWILLFEDISKLNWI